MMITKQLTGFIFVLNLLLLRLCSQPCLQRQEEEENIRLKDILKNKFNLDCGVHKYAEKYSPSLPPPPPTPLGEGGRGRGGVYF